MSITRRLLLASAATLAMPALAVADTTTVEFYFPVAVGGPITKIIDGFAADFMKENPDVTVKPVYAGSYQDTLTKTVTATKSGNGPQFAVLLSTDVFSLIDDDLIVPFDSSDAEKAWLAHFYPAFMANGQVNDRVWGVPFQRSTIVLYYNKDAFAEAGLDPAHPPATWAEHAAFAEKLTKRDGDRVTRWGVQIPAGPYAYWLGQALVTQAGGQLVSDNGTKVHFNDPSVASAIQYWLDLSNVHHAHPPGVSDWGTTPRDFLEGKAAMIWHTTGNLTNIRTNAKFPFGVAMLPADQRRGSPTGGGNFYIFKGASPAQQAASLRFIKWATTPERAAAWGVATGYVATRPDAWETPAMKSYVEGFPAAAVARDQLAFAVPEFSTHDNQRVTQLLNDAVESALLGKQPVKAALDTAQSDATRILRSYAHG